MEELASHLYTSIQDILNWLHWIGQQVENRDIIRYALKAFPRNTFWAFMVDAYKVSRNFSKTKLDELFLEFELYKQTNSSQDKKGLTLLIGQIMNKESKCKFWLLPNPKMNRS